MSNVLVTGSSRGIGKQIALRFIEEGHDVTIHGTTFDSPRALDEFSGDLEDLRCAMGATDLLVGDLTDTLPLEILRDHRAPFDVVVNCAGGDIGAVGVWGPKAGRPAANNPIDVARGDVMALFERNFLTTWGVCSAVVPGMIAQGHGSIVNIGSMNVALKLPEGAVYSAMKAAVHHYTRTLAEFLRPHGIRVNCVAPGGTTTPRFYASRAINKELTTGEGLIRYARPREIATAVYDVAMGLEFATGQIIYVDGGMA